MELHAEIHSQFDYTFCKFESYEESEVKNREEKNTFEKKKKQIQDTQEKIKNQLKMMTNDFHQRCITCDIIPDARQLFQCPNKHVMCIVCGLKSGRTCKVSRVYSA